MFRNVGVCDTSKTWLWRFLKRYSGKMFFHYLKMVEEFPSLMRIVADLPKLPYPLVKELIKKRSHVLLEKPFCLKP